ncbi:MAG: carbohydrate kinase [Verrucomicrobiales bacterium]|nr:carbohydrate kinase [Verrucomicrobiales bacterium]
MILVTGEALIDMLPGTTSAGETILKPTPGGSPFNVALALGRLGAQVRFLCPFSTDAFGCRLAATLEESGVDLSAAPRTRALSTLGFVDLDPKTKAARYAFYTDNTAGCGLRREDLPLPLASEITALNVGSFSLAVEPFGSAVETLVGDHAGDRLVALDPNVRTFLIGNRDRFLMRYLRLVGRADILKMSVEDLEWLHPRSTIEEASRAYRDAGVGLVVVTRGADGATAIAGDLVVSVGAEPVHVVDTVGAGDTFQAAMLVWLAERNRLSRPGVRSWTEPDLRSLLHFASKAAALTCARAGCQPPRRAEIAP